MNNGRYQFRPMTTVDLALVRQWLTLPHVTQWWGDPDEQFALVTADLDEPAMDQFIVTSADTPLGYLQCYQLTQWNTGFGAQPEGTRGIDLFIGVPDKVEYGHGSALIRAFADNLLAAQAPRVVTDTDPQNGRAIRAYENAGFRQERLVDTPDALSLLMVRNV